METPLCKDCDYLDCENCPFVDEEEDEERLFDDTSLGAYDDWND